MKHKVINIAFYLVSLTVIVFTMREYFFKETDWIFVSILISAQLIISSIAFLNDISRIINQMHPYGELIVAQQEIIDAQHEIIDAYRRIIEKEEGSND